MPPYAYVRYLQAARTTALHTVITPVAEVDTALWSHTLTALTAEYLPTATADDLAARIYRTLAPVFDSVRGIPLSPEHPIARTAAVVRLGAVCGAPSLLALADRAAEDLLRRIEMGEDFTHGEQDALGADVADALLRLALAELPRAAKDPAWARRLARHWHGAAQITDRLCERPRSAAAVAQIARFARVKAEERTVYTRIAEAAYLPYADSSDLALAAHSLYLLTGKERYLAAAARELTYALSPLSPDRFPYTRDAYRAACCLAETLFPTAFVLLRADGSVWSAGCRAVRSTETLAVIYTRPIHFLHLTLASPCLLLTPHHRIPLSEGKHALCAATGRRIHLPL